MSTPSFLACTKCNAINWRTDAYIKRSVKERLSCWRCHDWRNEFTRVAVWRRLTLAERFYIVRWHLWEQHQINRNQAGPGILWYLNPVNFLFRDTQGAEPHWYLRPKNVIREVYCGLTAMREYNRVIPEGDHERPEYIAAMRAELSGHHAPRIAPVDFEADVLSRIPSLPGH